MKRTLVVTLVFIAMIAALGAWHAFNAASEAARSDAAPEPNTLAASADSNPGASMEQVIQKIMPKGPTAPEIASSTWLNSPALAPQDLRGHVVVVEFWTHG
jgi:hypothetical protein